MNILTIDFESFYSVDFSLTKLTTEEYVRDDRFEVIGVAVGLNGAEPEWFSGTHEQTKEWLNKFDWCNHFALAHNAMFDSAILSWVFGIKPMAWLDTLAMARATDGLEAGNSLAKLATRYNLGVKGTEVVDAKGLRRADFGKAQLNQYGEYCKNDVTLTYDLFNVLVQRFSKHELKLIDLTMKMFSEPVLRLDTPLLEQHLMQVKARKEKLLEACISDKDTLMSNPKLAELFISLGVEPPMKISPANGKETYAFAKSDEGFKALAEYPDERIQAIVAARLGTKSTLEETRTERFISISKRGRMPVPLRYYAAHTGRWGGDDKLNLQNLPRKSLLKEAIVAPDGYVLVGADLSNIELRVGLWLSGEFDKLQMLKNGNDLYKDFASKVFNVAYDEVTSDQRFIGKTSQLSLIYGTGANKLHTAIKVMSGTDIGLPAAKSIVDLYRQEYSGVKNSWNAGSQVLEAIHNNQQFYIGHNNFATVEGKNGILLPSGLYMRYPELQKTETQDRGVQWCYSRGRRGVDHIYGAKVFQGLTQATARCIMGEQMLKVAKCYKVVLTIHDAMYLIAKEEEAQEALDFTLKTMRQAPKWMVGIPLDAEGSYGKTLADC